MNSANKYLLPDILEFVYPQTVNKYIYRII